MARHDTAYRELTAWAGRDQDKLHHVAASLGYKPGWAYHRARALEVKANSVDLDLFDKEEPYRTRSRRNWWLFDE
jgi:hypothetical protein